ncbi:MAG: hypothetical protein F6J86_01320 [Symploca sp. SIO1B1]|nr:hypothetical protein [Symploca sp. SIO1C2]NER92502.1 hypothetical protein [Symploca sp. SIO1B1]
MGNGEGRMGNGEGRISALLKNSSSGIREVHLIVETLFLCGTGIGASAA